MTFRPRCEGPEEVIFAHGSLRREIIEIQHFCEAVFKMMKHSADAPFVSRRDLLMDRLFAGHLADHRLDDCGDSFV